LVEIAVEWAAAKRGDAGKEAAPLHEFAHAFACAHVAPAKMHTHKHKHIHIRMHARSDTATRVLPRL
jgi:hypothetical protein